MMRSVVTEEFLCSQFGAKVSRRLANQMGIAKQI